MAGGAVKAKLHPRLRLRGGHVAWLAVALQRGGRLRLCQRVLPPAVAGADRLGKCPADVKERANVDLATTSVRRQTPLF